MDNIRESNPNLYQRIPSWFHVTDRTRPSPGLEKCGYCCLEVLDCVSISIIRNGKRREVWRCKKCSDDIHQDRYSIDKS